MGKPLKEGTRVIGMAINARMQEDINNIHAIQTLYKSRTISSTMRMLLQIGINQYKQDERYTRLLELAHYKQEHDGLLPYQYDQAEIDSAFSMFDTIE